MNLKSFSVMAAILVSTAGTALADSACLLEGQMMSERIKERLLRGRGGDQI